MKLWIKYGLLNAIIGLLVGSYITWKAIGGGYYVFIFSAPMAAFITGGSFWRIFMRKNEKLHLTKIIVTGVLTGTVSHYVTFLLISTALHLCYRINDGCTGFFGDPPTTWSGVVSGAFLFSFLGIMLFGWITAPASVIIGFVLQRTEDKKLFSRKDCKTE